MAAPTEKPPSDDSGIPPKCRPRAALDDQKCYGLLFECFRERNLRLNRRDKAANATLKEQILASKTLSGDTVSATLKYAAHRIPFFVLGWYFAYSRSGADYAVLDYGDKRSDEGSHVSDLMLMFDDDVNNDGISVENSSTLGYIVWKVTGNGFEP